MLKTFTYTKANGDVSTRTVYPLRNVDDKLLSIDLSEYTDEERAVAVIMLDAIHKEYIQAIYDAGFANNFRNFFLDKMT